MSRTRLLLPAVVYAGILALSAVPGDRFGDLGVPPGLSYVAHVIEYATLGGALRWALDGTRRPFTAALAVGAVLAAADELFQSTVPNRDASAVDWTVDVLALAASGGLVGRWAERRNR